MPIQTITKYRTTDGHEFDSFDAATTHDQESSLLPLINEFLSPERIANSSPEAIAREVARGLSERAPAFIAALSGLPATTTKAPRKPRTPKTPPAPPSIDPGPLQEKNTEAEEPPFTPPGFSPPAEEPSDV